MTKAVSANPEIDKPYLLKEMSGHVLWLTLNRPEKRNPLSLAMIRGLKTAFDEAFQEPNVRVIVLAALGPVYCAGHDLREMMFGDTSAQQEAIQREILTNCAEMMLTIVQGAKPVIACVQGVATAGGCQLVSTCDLAICAENAKFCTPGVNIGGFCTTPLVGIGRKIQRKHAMEMALTGDLYSAEDALRFGLVNRVVPTERLTQETESLAQKIASKSSLGIQNGKPAFYQQLDLSIEEAYAFALDKMIEANSTVDATEGTNAFFEKRKPRWSGL